MHATTWWAWLWLRQARMDEPEVMPSSGVTSMCCTSGRRKRPAVSGIHGQTKSQTKVCSTSSAATDPALLLHQHAPSRKLTSEQAPVSSWHSRYASSCVPLDALQPACRGPTAGKICALLPTAMHVSVRQLIGPFILPLGAHRQSAEGKPAAPLLRAARGTTSVISYHPAQRWAQGLALNQRIRYYPARGGQLSSKQNGVARREGRR